MPTILVCDDDKQIVEAINIYLTFPSNDLQRLFSYVPSFPRSDIPIIDYL